MAERSVVAILDFDPGKHFARADIERAVLGPDVELRLVRHREPSAVVSRIADADVLIVWSRFDLTAATLSRLPRCRGIVCASVGYDHVDLEAAERGRIAVCNVPDYGTEEVADHTLALMLGVLRGIPRLHPAVGAGRWDWRDGAPLRRLSGLRLGIVGLGRIGTATALRARAFGFDIGFYDPHLPVGIEKALSVRRFDSLDGLLAETDVLSLHTPSTDETRAMIDGNAFATLPEDAILVNTARGDLVETEALIAALASGRLAGAGLDVIAGEPDPPESLRTHPQVLWTPHSAWYARESFSELRTRSATYAAALLAGRSVPTRLSQAAGPGEVGGQVRPGVLGVE